VLKDLKVPHLKDSKEISETHHKVLKEVKVLKVSREDLVTQDLRSKETEEIKDPLVLQDHRELREMLTQGQREIQDQQDLHHQKV
jgi:hypothetical protein